MSYKSEQEKWLEKNNVKVGDEVTVIKKVKGGFKNGWRSTWQPMMDQTVNKVGIYKGFNDGLPAGGLEVAFPNEEIWWYPYYTLRPVNSVENGGEGSSGWFLLD